MRYASPSRLVAQVTKFLTMAPTTSSTITAVFSSHTRNMHQFTCTKRTASDNKQGSEVTAELWVRSTELASYQPSGAMKLEVTPPVVKNCVHPCCTIIMYRPTYTKGEDVQTQNQVDLKMAEAI
jgi:hypothetical protein